MIGCAWRFCESIFWRDIPFAFTILDWFWMVLRNDGMKGRYNRSVAISWHSVGLLDTTLDQLIFNFNNNSWTSLNRPRYTCADIHIQNFDRP